MVWAVRRIQLKMEHELTSEHHIKAMRQKVAKIKARPAAAAVAAAAVSLPAACPVLIIFNCSYFGVKSNHGSASAGRRVRLPAFRLTAARFRCVTQKIWRTARMQKEMHPRWVEYFARCPQRTRLHSLAKTVLEAHTAQWFTRHTRNTAKLYCF